MFGLTSRSLESFLRPVMAPIDSKTLLNEVESLCQTQIIRISKQPQPQSGQVPLEDQIAIAQAANAMPVLHAGGRRKPSLSELDQTTPPRRYNRPRERF